MAAKRPQATSRRTAARLAAVQALYQVALADGSAERIIADVLAGKGPAPEEEDAALAALPAPDPELFGAIVRGVIASRARIDDMIGGALTTEWTVDRLELLVRLILEAGVFELTERTDVPPKVAINEYLNIAHAFFDGDEPALINGVLDSIARAYRGAEMSASAGG